MPSQEVPEPVVLRGKKYLWFEAILETIFLVASIASIKLIN